MVVMAAKGYPGSYGKGSVIDGLDAAAARRWRRNLPCRHQGRRRPHHRQWRPRARRLRRTGKTGRARRRRAPTRRWTGSTGRTASAAAISGIARSGARKSTLRPRRSVCAIKIASATTVACREQAHDLRSTGRRPIPAPRTWRRRCASMPRGSKPTSRRNAPDFKGPLTRASSSRAASRTRPICWKRRRANTCCGASRPASCLPSAHAVDREFRSISALHAQGFPVAEPVLYCADESIAGTAFYVMGYVEGRVIWVPDMPDSNPAERAAVFDAMNATLARLHSYRSRRDRACRLRPRRELRRAPGRPLVEAVSRLGDREDRRDGAHHGVAAGASAAGRPGAAGARRLPARQHDPASRASRRVLAVLDWELSTLGRSARRLHLSLHAVAHAAFGFRRRHRLAGRARPQGARHSVARATTSTPTWRAPGSIRGRISRSISAYNFFRLAAILQGIVGRVRDGTATNENAPPRAQMVRPLAATAWEFAREAGAQSMIREDGNRFSDKIMRKQNQNA